MGDAYSNKTASLATTVRYNSSGLVMVGKRLFPLNIFPVYIALIRLCITMYDLYLQGRLGERFYVVGGLNYCEDHQTVALESCAG